MNEELSEKGYDANYGKYCDHTVLRAYTTSDKVIGFCREAKKYGAASVCVNPIHVALVKKNLEGTGIKTAAVIGFPLGANRPETKAFEARLAAEDGAEEVDMVINIGALREKNDALVLSDIKGVVDAVKGRAAVKVIIETCYLSDEEKIRACRLSEEAGADFVKTSTGKIDVAATPEAAVVMCQAIRDYYQKTGRKVGFKAAGGVRTAEDAALYYTIVEEILGPEWLNTDMFRIGASSAANNLLSAIEGREIKYY